jgi:hydroxyacylglutathione hydrolase
MKVIQIQVGQMANFTYILAETTTSEAIVIDPSWDLHKIFDILSKNAWTLKYIINTHTHFDHILGNKDVARQTGAKIVQHDASRESKDLTVSDNDLIKLRKNLIKVVHTPGHSKESICLIANDQWIFTGDTLFVGNCGRVDLPGSDPREMYESLYNRISKLDESLIVYPGHDYGNSPTSTIGTEKRTNHVLKCKSKEEFLSLMTSD